MKIKNAISYSIVLIMASLLLSVPCFAVQDAVISVERCVPDDFTVGEANEIVLNISGDDTFTVGIVETIPNGYSFPENDEDVSDCKHFKVDRDAKKITFAANSENSITYAVIPSEKGEASFEGFWVDMLTQSQELNQGKNMWVSLSSSNDDSSDSNQGNVTQTGESTNKTDMGIVILVGVILVILIACFVFWKKHYQKAVKK